MDAFERANAERAAYYADFDRAVATLDKSQAAQVDLHASRREENGTWILRDAGLAVIKSIPDPARQIEPPPSKKIQQDGNAKRSQNQSETIKLIFKVLEHFKQEHLDIAKYAIALEKRVKDLESRERIDDELVSEVGKALGRIDDIERRGFRFVGKYQAPNTYKLGDVVSYSDKLWHCVQEAKAGDRPVTASHKWSLMLAGGTE